MKSGIALRGGSGHWAHTTIDAMTLDRVLWGDYLDNTTVIEGITFAYGTVADAGAGMSFRNSDLSIINCRVVHCRSTNHGGGMLLQDSSPTIMYCLFDSDTSGVDGGVLYITGGSPYLYDCQFSSNTSSGEGGCAYITNHATPTFEFCTFEYSQAARVGGVIMSDGCAVTATGCGFTNNISDGGGGAIYLDTAPPCSVYYCLFDRNQTNGTGGAIHARDSELAVYGTTFHAHSAYTDGGSFYSHDSDVTIDNSIIAFGPVGQAVQCVGTPPFISCTDIYGNAGGDWVGCIASQLGWRENFSLDPLFCNREGYNLFLRSCSPCINHGSCGQVGVNGNGYCPRTWHVPGDAFSIQAGIDSACAGDTVMVSCGPRLEYNIQLKSGVLLTSATGTPDCATINGDNIDRVFYCVSVDSTAEVRGFTIMRGLATQGAGVTALGSDLRFTNCIFEDSWANGIGGAAMLNLSDMTFTDCEFIINGATTSGGAVYMQSSDPTFRNCTFYSNNCYMGSALYCYASDPIIENTIINKGMSGRAVWCESGSAPFVSCSDIYDNEGGDWIDCLAPQLGLRGNISADPRFCDPFFYDLTLKSTSPCFLSTCGVMGAHGLGCWADEPGIMDISDVGNDQGRQVRLRWVRSNLDAPGDTMVTEYAVFRRQDANLASGGGREDAALEDVALEGATPEYSGMDIPALGAAGWDYVTTVPAFGDSMNQAVVPTLCDSTSGGICWSVFLVRAVTDEPLYYLDSDPDSGYSIDNLAPAPPPGLILASPTELQWEEVPDEDFNYYTVYGSDQPALDGSAVLIGYTIGLTKDVAGHVYYYYHVTATDFSGNEGEESSVNNVFAGVPGIPDTGDIPMAFELGQGRPNPFSTMTVICFDLPENTNARIRIYDTHGRLIRRLTDSSYEAGRHTVTWRGEDDRGDPAAPGVYFVRMEAGAFEDMKKVMLLR
jgi:hypothetical protein